MKPRRTAGDVAKGVAIRAGAVVVGVVGLAVTCAFAYAMAFGFGTPPPDGNDYDPAAFTVEPEPPVRPDLPQDGRDAELYVPADGCVIKGNVSYNTGERIYHVPGQAYYDATIIDETAGERWFCTEDEAAAAGWRKSEV